MASSQKFRFGEDGEVSTIAEHEEEVKRLFAVMDMYLKEIEGEEKEKEEVEKKLVEEEEAELEALKEEGTTREKALMEFRALIQSVFDSSDEEKDE
ncbi:hypothetical protein ACET3Z_018126 [Daucus carota]|uniref:Uncharacterized protein n=1 Tax=Daucus carota subsp. sativus TaxID=79200 RepID=A0A164Y7G9_DAUCS